MASEELRRLAHGETEAFESYIDKLPEGRLKGVLADVLDEEVDGGIV